MERLDNGKHSSLICRYVVTNKACSITLRSTCGQLHKHFTLITYSHSIIRWAIHAPMQSFQNALTYFTTALCYDRKMLKNAT
jgi:hypothetical protein